MGGEGELGREGKERKGKEVKKKRGTYGHTQQSRSVMLKIEVLVCKRAGAVDRRTARAVAVKEVAALDHEVFDLRYIDRVRLTVSGVWGGKSWVRERLTTRWNLLPL